MTLEASDISFSYNQRFSLESISLRAEPGSFISVIGGNGAGKTTLLKLLSGLLTYSSGSITLDDKPVPSWSSNTRARHLAYIPQTHRAVFGFTVEQTILLGRLPYRSAYGGFEGEKDIAMADRALTLMHLEEFRHIPITRLSGGELQRVMIAKALAQDTDILVLDEPTTHLDIAHQQSVLNVLEREVRERGLTVIASQHDLNLASIFSDSIVVLSDGKLITHGRPDEVLTSDMIYRIYGIETEVAPQYYGQAPAIRYLYGVEGMNSGAHNVEGEKNGE